MTLEMQPGSSALDEETARAELYGVLAALYYAAPTPELLAQLRVAATEAPAAGGFLEEPWRLLVGAAREPEVAENGATRAAQNQNISRLYVTMNDATLVRVEERFGDVEPERERGGLGEWPGPRDPSREVLSVEEVHGEVRHAGPRARPTVEDPHDPGVVEGAKGVDLPREALALGRGRTVRSDELECDTATGAVGREDRAHPTPAERGAEPVRAYQGSRDEEVGRGHSLRLRGPSKERPLR